jgi:signal transduction histidine kinase
VDVNKEIQSESPTQRRALRFAQILRPLVGALGVIVLLGVLFEIVERSWLVHADMRVIHLLHKAGGILSSLLVGLVVGWTILKSSPGFLVVPPVGEEWLRQPRLTEAERTKLYARWFISMRWIAVLVAALLVVMTVKVVEWLPPQAWWPLVLTIAALAGVNLIYSVMVRLESALSVLLLLQAYLDLVMLTVLLQFSGGVENPLSMMMVFHVIIGGILLPRRQCFGIAAAGSLLFGMLIWAEYAEVLEHYTLEIYPHFRGEGVVVHPAHHPLFVMTLGVLQTVILFLTAYFVTTLAERMRYNERRLEAMADRALAERQLLERSLETTGAGLRVLNHDLQPYWVSNRWQGWFVTPTNTATGLLEGENSPAGQSLHDGQVRVTELALGADDGSLESSQGSLSERVFQVTTAPLLDAGGNISQVVELAQDITQQKQTHAKMMRAGSLAAVGELAGQVAHEVNNPIAIISAKAELLLSDHSGEMSVKVVQEVGKIRDLAQRVARIAQGLLSYCRPSVGTRVTLDALGPIRKSLTMIEEHAQRIGVRIEDRLPDRLPLIKANAHELEQVFLNLFLNALDAMPDGGRLRVLAHTGPVQLRSGKVGLALVVEDTGTGISKEFREKIFEPFFSTKKEGRGAGLGLSICSGLVRSHGGEIELESEVGKGSRFTVKFPVETSEPKDEQHG